MTEAKHAAGPWYNGDLKNKRHRYIPVLTDQGGRYGDGGLVAQVPFGKGHHFTFEEAEKFAALIAAAPDMYEALGEIIDQYQCLVRSSDAIAVETIRKGLDAIAKAEGRQP